MAPKNLLLLFLSTVALSLIVLIIFFSLFFKNVDVSFNTRMPDTAPEVETLNSRNPLLPAALPENRSKSSGLNHATISVPPEFKTSPSGIAQREKDSEVERNEKKGFFSFLNRDAAVKTDDAILRRGQESNGRNAKARQASSQGAGSTGIVMNQENEFTKRRPKTKSSRNAAPVPRQKKTAQSAPIPGF
ncbi:MAG: hypothetical protein AAGI66_05605 [Cyanobacteria bacterium P01_H01_bin.74]